jgi:hypothetical protein
MVRFVSRTVFAFALAVQLISLCEARADDVEGDGVVRDGHASTLKGVLNNLRPGMLTAKRITCDAATETSQQTAAIELSDGSKPPLAQSSIDQLCGVLDVAGVPVMENGDKLHWEISDIVCSAPHRRCTFTVVSRPPL